MRVARTCLLVVGLASVLGCNSQSFPGSNSGNSLVPTPSIVSFSPGSTPRGSPDILLNIEGTHLSPPGLGPAVLWNADGGQSSTFLEIAQHNDTHITGRIPAALLVSAGSATLQVQLYRGDGDIPRASSNTVEFTVTD